MNNPIDLPKDGRSWWKRRGIEVDITYGEKANICQGSDPDKLLASQEYIDAQRLIRLGNRTGDEEMVAIGQKRLRFVLDRPSADDLD